MSKKQNEFVVSVHCDNGGPFSGKTLIVGPNDKQIRGIFSESQTDMIEDFCERHNFHIMSRVERSAL